MKVYIVRFRHNGEDKIIDAVFRRESDAKKYTAAQVEDEDSGREWFVDAFVVDENLKPRGT